MEILRAKLTGVRPLMMHSGELADPNSQRVRDLKVITSKRKKTDEDHKLIRQLEWLAGLYLNSENRIVVPVDCVLATALNGAKKNKNGTEFKIGVVDVPGEEMFLLEYNGPKDPNELYKDARFCDYRGVRVQQARVMRSRPKFPEWSLKIALMYDPDVINRATLVQAITVGGDCVGLCEWRPRFGRYSTQVLQ